MVVPESGKDKRLLCRLNLRHMWVHDVDSDGQHFFRCAACGKDRRYDIERQDPHLGGSYFPGL